MNNYTWTCVVVGAILAGCMGILGVNMAGFQLSGIWGFMACIPFGAIAGYGASGGRVSTHRIHPYAKPTSQSKPPLQDRDDD